MIFLYSTNRWLLSFILLLSYVACQQTQSQPEAEVFNIDEPAYELIHLRSRLRRILDWQKDTIDFKQVKLPDGQYRLTYTYSDTLVHEYVFDSTASQAPLMYQNGILQTDAFKLEAKKEFVYGQETVSIFKFVRNYDVRDGCEAIFWNPEVGILLHTAPIWSNFIINYPVTEQGLNRKINALTYGLLNDDAFSKICLNGEMRFR